LRPTLPSMGRYRTRRGGFTLAGPCSNGTATTNSASVGRSGREHRVEPPTIKGFGAVILEQVMAEYFDVPPKIEFVPSGVCYELKGPVEAVTMKLH
jgi:hypothetical protein